MAEVAGIRSRGLPERLRAVAEESGRRGLRSFAVVTVYEDGHGDVQHQIQSYDLPSVVGELQVLVTELSLLRLADMEPPDDGA